MQRRDFLKGVGLTLIAIPVLPACVVDERRYRSEPPLVPPTSGGEAGGIESFLVANSDSSGHSHQFEITCSEEGANGRTYVATGPHTHEVTLSRAQLAAVFAGDRVTVQTSTPHAHTWLIQAPRDLACSTDDGGGGGGGDGGGDGGGGGGGGESFAIQNDDASGHSHSFEITCDEESGTGDRVFTATGPHTHQVPLSRDELDLVFAGQTILVETTGGGHSHTWLVSLPDSACL
jgi:hypothetical protein